jgi:hypothetical protein
MPELGHTERRAPDAMDVTPWHHKRAEREAKYAEQRRQLAEHFEAMHDLLEQMGLRPWGRLELRSPATAFDAEVIFRWERHRG